MQESHRVTGHSVIEAEPRDPILAAAVGASYTFEPSAEGIAGIYAARVLERGIDPRVLCADIRADRLGLIDRAAQRRALMARSRITRFGRGTATHLHATGAAELSGRSGYRAHDGARTGVGHRTRSESPKRGLWPRRLAMAPT